MATSNRKMTKAEVKAWMERWKRVNEAEKRELRATPVDVRMRQLGTLMHWALELGWAKDLASEEEAVRERWAKLRKAYGA